MSFEFGQATEFDSLDRVRMLGSAMRKTGRPVVLVPLGSGVHAGHISLIRAAKQLPRAVVVVAWQCEETLEDFAREGVDVIWKVRDEDLWSAGEPSVVVRPKPGLEPADALAADLTRHVALIGALGPSDVVVGEKDFELIVALARAVSDLHLGVQLHSVPTVRMPGGLAISLRNSGVEESARDDALVLSAALTAGAHAAEHGASVVLETAHSVLAAAGIEPEYLELRGLDFGPAPEQGDARLLAAATIGGVRLIDNVGVPVGVGFKNLGEQE